MKTIIILSFVAIVTLFTYSCEKYQDGSAGNAYLSLSWSGDKPDYIETGNSSFPTSFYFDTYYRVIPGYYTLYYEGYVWNGYSNAKYSWEVDYEIWENPGELATNNQDGADGADTYFDIDLSPYGPYINSSKLNYKSINNEIIKLENGDYQLFKRINGINIKITYKNATNSNLFR